MTIPWVKALHQWASAQAKSCTYAADVAEDALTTYAKNVAQPAATENLQPYESTHGRQKRFKDKE